MPPNTFPRKDCVEGAPCATAANWGGVKSMLTGIYTRVSTQGQGARGSVCPENAKKWSQVMHTYETDRLASRIHPTWDILISIPEAILPSPLPPGRSVPIYPRQHGFLHLWSSQFHHSSGRLFSCLTVLLPWSIFLLELAMFLPERIWKSYKDSHFRNGSIQGSLFLEK